MEPEKDDIQNTDIETNDSDNLNVDAPTVQTKGDKPVNEGGDEPTGLLDAVLEDNPELAEGADDELDIAVPVNEADDAAKTESAEQKTDEQPGDEKDEESSGEDSNVEPRSEEAGEQQQAQEEEPAELTSRELQRMSSKTRRKVRALQQRAAQVNELTPHADAAKGLNTWLKESQIGNEDFQVLLGIGAALQKGDFKTFLEGVQPYVQLAQEATGQAIPADLRDQVIAGQMTEEVARQLAQQRIKQQVDQAQLQHQVTANEDAHKRQQQQHVQQNAEVMKAAVVSWEDQVKATDPDYARKQGAVIAFSRQIFAQEGLPKTPEEAVAIAKRAYEQVNEVTRSVQPRPKPTNRIPSATDVSNSGAQPEPTTLAEAAMSGLRRANSR